MTQALVRANLPTLSTGSLDSYIQAVRNLPVLSTEEEQALARRLRDDGDLDAARDLVMSHLRFVVHIARGYMGYGLPLADLIQEGNIGLMKAVKRFDPDQKVRLVSFAVHWIRAEIHEFILRNWRIVKVATTKAQRKLFFNLRRAKKHLGWLSADEAEKVAEDLGVPTAQVYEMESRLTGSDVGYDGPTDGDDEGPPSPVAYLEDQSLDPGAAIEAEDLGEHRTDLLVEALEGLDERSRRIIEARWLADDKTTLQKLADEYGVSAERIRQLENNAMKKLRSAMAA